MDAEQGHRAAEVVQGTIIMPSGTRPHQWTVLPATSSESRQGSNAGTRGTHQGPRENTPWEGAAKVEQGTVEVHREYVGTNRVLPGKEQLKWTEEQCKKHTRNAQTIKGQWEQGRSNTSTPEGTDQQCAVGMDAEQRIRQRGSGGAPGMHRGLVGDGPEGEQVKWSKK
jgi:hypothetical protein